MSELSLTTMSSQFEAESAPEAHHVFSCARVEEAGARKRLGRQKWSCLLQNKLLAQLLAPSIYFIRVNSLWNGQVLGLFGRHSRQTDEVVDQSGMRRQVANDTQFRFVIRLNLLQLCDR